MGGDLEITLNKELDWKGIIHRCFRCGYCKYTKDFSNYNCPSYKQFGFETYSTGGRLWLAYGLINGDISWNNNVANVLYACTTCGNCSENCRFDKFKDFLVDFIEAARVEAVETGFCPDKQKALLERTKNTDMYNPYGEKNSDNKVLREKYNLPDDAEWVYYIGCTSNYRQLNLRDATIRFLKKAKISFTLIDEHCCCSPIIRTGQINPVKEFVNYNVSQIKKTGAKKIITSCAGCYRTINKDWPKFGIDYDFEVYHTVDLINKLLGEGKLKFKTSYDKTLTYHDPCHIGRHMGIYEVPRNVYKQIPGVNFKEMKRNKENTWCCGAGGGVKIGYPDWSVEISKERLEEAKETGATVISSICPFCRTNLNDANEQFKMGFEIKDLIEIIDNVDIEFVCNNPAS